MTAANDLGTLVERLEAEQERHDRALNDEELQHGGEVDSIVAELDSLIQQIKDELEDSHTGEELEGEP